MKNHLPKGLLLYLIIVCFNTACQVNNAEEMMTIQIYYPLPEKYNFQDIKIFTGLSDYVLFPTFKYQKPEIQGSNAVWSFSTDKPIYMNAQAILGKQYQYVILEPGDSIVINRNKTGYAFSGRGSEKLQLFHDLKELQQQIPLPHNSKFLTVNSFEDFREWDRYSNNLSFLADSIIKLNEKKISYDALNSMKEFIYSEIEYKRLTKLELIEKHQDSFHVTSTQLENVFDSIINNKNIKWLRTYTANPSNYYLYYDLIRKQVHRKHHFDLANDTLNNALRKLEYAQLIEEQYKGYVEESCLTYLVSDQGIKEHNLKEEYSPIIDTLLKKYYARPGYEKYRVYMRQYEAKIQRIVEWKKREQLEANNKKKKS